METVVNAATGELLVYVQETEDGIVDCEVRATVPEGQDEGDVWYVSVRPDPDVKVVVRRAAAAAGFPDTGFVEHHEYITSGLAYGVEFFENGPPECVWSDPNHSDDRWAIFRGSPTPIYICGFHRASRGVPGKKES